MANNARVTLVFDVQQDGSLKLATRNLNDAAQAANNLNNAQNSAAKGARNHSDAINGGVSSANNGTRGFAKLKESINGSNGVVAAYATLATQAFAVSAAFSKLREAAQTEQLMRGLAEQGIRTGNSLNSTAKGMQQITGYAISMGEAMRGAAQVAAAGFSPSTMEALTRAATDSATALGRNVPDALDRFIKGTTKLEPELLDEMGIMVKLDQATSQYAQTIGKVPSQLTATEKRTAYLNAVLEEGKLKFEGMAEAAGINPYDKLAAAFSDLLNKALTALNNAGIIDFVQKLADNSQFLTTTLIWFGTTIIKQVIPGLYGTATAAAASAAALRDEATALRSAAEEAEKKAEIERKSAVEAAKTLSIQQQNKNAYKEYASAVSKGIETEDQKKAALRSLSGQIGAVTRQQRELSAQVIQGLKTDDGQLENLKQLKKAYEDQKKAVLDLEQAKARAEAGSTEGKALLDKLHAQEGITTLMADAKGSFASSMAAAGKGNLKEAFSEMKLGLESMKAGMLENDKLIGTFSERFKAGFDKMKVSILNVGSAIKGFITGTGDISRTQKILDLVRGSWLSLGASITAAGGIMNFTKLAFTGLAMSVKILGLAVLNAIPVIGQMIMMFQLAVEYAGTASEWVKNLFRSEEEKAFAKKVKTAEKAVEEADNKITAAQDALNESLENAIKIGDRYRSFLSGAAVDASKQAQAIIAVNNNIADMVDRLKTLRGEEQAKAALEQELDRLRASSADKEGTSAALDAATKQTEEFQVLTKIMANTTSTNRAKIEEFMKSLSKIPDEKGRKKAMLDFLSTTGEEALKASQNMMDLSSSMTAADKAAQDFSRSLVQSTSFDKVVDSFREVNNVVANLKKELSAASTKQDIAAQVNQISEKISDSMVGLLDKANQDMLYEFRGFQQVALEYKTLGDGIKNNQELSNALRSAGLAVETKINDKAKEYLTTLQQGLVTAQDKLMRAQSEERTIQSTIALENARFKNFQRIGGETKEAAIAQDAHEEKLQKLEQQRLDIQADILDAQIAGIEASKGKFAAEKAAYEIALNDLKTKRETLNVQVQLSKLLLGSRPTQAPSGGGGLLLLKRKQEAWDANNAAIVKSEEAVTSLDGYIAKTTDSIIEMTRQQEIFNTASNSAIKGLKDAQTSIRNLRDQLTIGNMTEAEKQARNIALDLKVVQSITTDINSLNDIYLDILNKQNAARDKGVASIILQVKYAKSTLQATLNQIDAQRKAGREALETRQAQLLAIRENSNLTAKEREDADAELKLVESRLIVYNKMTLALSEQARINMQNQLLDVAYINTSKEGLEIQQKALDILYKRSEEQQKLSDTIANGAALEAKIAAKKLGRELSPEEQRQLDLNAAKRALAIAEDQLAIKIQGINLEYALLEAQRIQTVLELTTQKKILEAKLKASQGGSLTKDQQLMLNQLTTALDTMGRNSYNSIRDIAVQTAKEEVNNKRREVTLLSINSSLANTSDDILSNVLRAMDAATTISKLRKEGDTISGQTATAGVFGTGPTAQIPDLTTTLNDGLSEINRYSSDLEEVFKPLTLQFSSLGDVANAVNAEFQALATTLHNLTPDAIKALRDRENPTSSTTSTAADIKEAATQGVQRALANGFAAAEWNGTKVRGATGLTRQHEDPGHQGGYSFDAQLKGKAAAQMTAFVEAEVLKGAKAIWQGLVYQLKDGKVSTSKYTPSRDATGDIMHMRHAHLSYANAILDTTNATTDLTTAGDRATTSLNKVADTGNKFVETFRDLTVSPSVQATTAQPTTQQPTTTPANDNAELLTAQTIADTVASQTEVNLDKLTQNLINQKFGTNFQSGDTAEQSQTKLDAMGLSSGGKDRLTQYVQEVQTSGSELQDRLYQEIFGNGKLEAMSSDEASKAVEIFKTTYAEQMGGLAQTAYEKAFPMGALNEKLTAFWTEASTTTQPFLDSLKTLGPDGELVASIYSGVQNITTSISGLAATLESGSAGFQDYAKVASAVISSVGNILASGSKAKIANIDKEIAAEEKRDGKSKESVAKLAALKKKKEAEERKAFERDKKIKMAQTVISTAAAIAKTIGEGGAFAIPLAIAVGALGMAQLAIIAGSSFQGSESADLGASMPTTLSIGKRDSSVNLAKGPNANAGGEVGYLRGSSGTGTTASNYNTIGSAYGGDLTRGYGNRGFIVGEKGPELITPETPVNVTPANDVAGQNPVNATINIQAIDSQGVQDVLVAQKGNIIKMLREAANASGQRFLEDVNVNVYTRPNISRL